VLKRAFRDVPRVDMGIDSVIEGHTGRAFVDNPTQPSAFELHIEPFCYLAGDFSSDGAIEMIRQLKPYLLLMTYPDKAIRIAREYFGERLVRFPRYSFSSDSLSVEQISAILEDSPHRSRVISIDAGILDQVSRQPNHFLDISAFQSAEDFLTRGLGYAVSDNNTLAGVTYSSLVSNAGIEVSIYVEPNYRRQGVATALGGALIMECLSRNIDPHWDAANAESCILAEKLGYSAAGCYDAYYVSCRQP
jgi:GNAT superfamily N-acetyltransferase